MHELPFAYFIILGSSWKHFYFAEGVVVVNFQVFVFEFSLW